ncbi:MAG: YhbY family RNA-binding protein [Candidatus Altiarchaeota archaeon]
MDELKTLNIGKDGVKDSLIKEARVMISKYQKIRIKLLKSALSEKRTDEIAREVALKTNSKLMDVRGHTFILARK